MSSVKTASRVVCPARFKIFLPAFEVVNVGLNGVLVTEAQTSRTFTLRAEDWAKPIEQPIYVVGQVESNSPTMHPSAPLLLKVAANKQTASASQGSCEASRSPNPSDSSRIRLREWPELPTSVKRS